MEDAVHETDGGRFVWVLVWDLDVYFPVSASEGCCNIAVSGYLCLERQQHTLFRSLKSHVELLPIFFVSKRDSERESNTDTASD
jgi:hypothetical protein